MGTKEVSIKVRVVTLKVGTLSKLVFLSMMAGWSTRFFF